MNHIHVLDIKIANLIAAGEVVERPSSVVKELLENSIDAGAKNIIIETKNGGVSFIRVTDDGHGMSFEDTKISLKRHATSKINSQNDLNSITTLGFRGEALAAISSVSDVKILTKVPENDIGTVLIAKNGIVTYHERQECPNGTTILVNNLFENFPARRKFLKKDISETASIINIVEKIALSRPDISFRLITDGKIKFNTNGKNILYDTIYMILGKEFAKQLIEIDEFSNGIKLYGYITNPQFIKGNRNYQNFFINGRYFKSTIISSALEQAYRTFIPGDKFPCCILNIQLHPSLVDVNVHPTKLEIKFSNEKLIFDTIYYSTLNILHSKTSIPVINNLHNSKNNDEMVNTPSNIVNSLNHYDTNKNTSYDSDLIKKHENINIAKQTADSFNITSGVKFKNNNFFQDNNVKDIEIREDQINTNSIKNDNPKFINHDNKNIDLNCNNNQTDNKSTEYSNITNNKNVSKEIDNKNYRIVGELFRCYIVVEIENKTLIIDKHAAHERIIFEQLKYNINNQTKYTQSLLIPEEICIDNSYLENLTNYVNDLKNLGFIINIDENKKTMTILSIPTFLTKDESITFIEEYINGINTNTINDISITSSVVEKAIFQASCKAATKSGYKDTIESLQSIANKVINNNNIRFCPHGRPVAFEISKQELEKMFKRG